MNNTEKIFIRFLGAAGTVTGSKYLVSAYGKILLIDCGLFQGLKKLRLLNWETFPVHPASIDMVLLTHGHLDHVGYLPLLVKHGYRNPILATSATIEVAKVILEDSGRIQEEEAATALRLRYSKHSNPQPLYTLEDAQNVFGHFSAQKLNEWIVISDRIAVRFRYNSHIIGATFIELKIGDKLVIFSGDIGREDDPLLFPPDKPDNADILCIETTYGDKLHPKDAEEQLIKAIHTAAQQNGTIIVPSFAVERTQSLMYLLWKLRQRKAIPDIPVYMDSPMGTNVLDIFHHNTEWHKLSPSECTEMCADIRVVKTIEETQRLADDPTQKIIIAGSGMVSGGRVLTYLQQYLPDHSATVLLVGYQAEGTRGRQMLEGAKEVKIKGQYYSVRANIVNIQGLSAHADQQGLLNWMSSIKKKPQHLFLVHGEAQAADAFRVKVKDIFGWECEIPELFETKELDFTLNIS